MARLARILNAPGRPVQIVIAGKAHPLDGPGKSLIREIVQHTRDPEMARRMVFVEDYGIYVARELVGGVDVWLNTPRRGEEACGTSGMKAAVNGVLNLSILDGWFDEAWENSGGWAIGDREPYAEDQDEIHASALYSILENQIIPLFHDNREQGVPQEWMRRVKQSLVHITPQFNSQRMVAEYQSQLYEPAHRAWGALSGNHFQAVRERSRWNDEVLRAWDRVSFVETGPGPNGPVTTGRPVPIRAAVELAGLSPKDVRVEAVVGRIGTNGNLEDTQVMTLPAVEQRGSVYVFMKEFVPHQTGRLGYALRISPNHYDDPLTRPCNSLLRWGME